MCGIFGFINKNLYQCNYPIKLIEKANQKNILRGSDGFGFVSFSIDNIFSFKDFSKINKEKREKNFKEIEKYLNSISTVISCSGIYRAKPETEVSSSLKNMQPIIIDDKYSIVHNGAISEKHKKEINKLDTEIDSEIILRFLMEYKGTDLELLKRHIKNVLEKLDGGFSFHVHEKIDENIHINIITSKYHPLYYYETDDYFFYSSVDLSDGFFKMQEFPEYSFKFFITYDKNILESDFIKFKPYFRYPNTRRIKKIRKMNIATLVAASGGIDSTTNICLCLNQLNKLKQEDKINDYLLKIVHFKYGHRGEEAEEEAIKNIYNHVLKSNDYLNKNNFQLDIIDLKSIYSILNCKNSQLLNKDLLVTTGTKEDLKSTIAWVPVRNMLFSTIMAGIAETLILEYDFHKVLLVSGWNQLSEEGFYPDNSERFVKAFHKLCNFGTLCGQDIVTFPITRNIMKYEQWALAKHYGFLDVFKYTISCDIPVHDKETKRWYNCDGQCGSTLLSKYAADMLEDITDPREFRVNKDHEIICKDRLYDNRNNKKYKTDDIIDGIIKRVGKIEDYLGGLLITV